MLVYVTETCYLANAVIFDTASRTHHKLLACGGTIVHAEFSPDGACLMTAAAALQCGMQELCFACGDDL